MAKADVPCSTHAHPHGYCRDSANPLTATIPPMAARVRSVPLDGTLEDRADHAAVDTQSRSRGRGGLSAADEGDERRHLFRSGKALQNRRRTCGAEEFTLDCRSVLTLTRRAEVTDCVPGPNPAISAILRPTGSISTLLLEAFRDVTCMRERAHDDSICIKDDCETELDVDLCAVRTHRPGG